MLVKYHIAYLYARKEYGWIMFLSSRGWRIVLHSVVVFFGRMTSFMQHSVEYRTLTSIFLYPTVVTLGKIETHPKVLMFFITWNTLFESSYGVLQSDWDVFLDIPIWKIGYLQKSASGLPLLEAYWIWSTIIEFWFFSLLYTIKVASENF